MYKEVKSKYQKLANNNKGRLTNFRLQLQIFYIEMLSSLKKERKIIFFFLILKVESQNRTFV